MLVGLIVGTMASAVAAAQTTTVPEPAGLWQGPMHSATPATLRGATVLDVTRLSNLIVREHPVMIDVSNSAPRPPSLAADAVWAPAHRSLPGTTWLPGAGEGTNDPGFKAAFEATAARLTGGDKDKPVVTFCHPNRWGSWNAAKRLTDLGYHHVYWFPGGAEGWVEGGKTLVESPAPPSPNAFETAAKSDPSKSDASKTGAAKAF